MQADHLSLDVKDLQPFIATIAPSDERARKAQAMLLSWNAVMDKDRAEPLIYTAFLRSLHKILIEDKTGLPMNEKGPFAATTLDIADARPSFLVRLSGRARSRTAARRWDGRSTTDWPCSSSATAPI